MKVKAQEVTEKDAGHQETQQSGIREGAGPLFDGCVITVDVMKLTKLRSPVRTLTTEKENSMVGAFISDFKEGQYSSRKRWWKVCFLDGKDVSDVNKAVNGDFKTFVHDVMTDANLYVIDGAHRLSALQNEAVIDAVGQKQKVELVYRLTRRP